MTRGELVTTQGPLITEPGGPIAHQQRNRAVSVVLFVQDGITTGVGRRITRQPSAMGNVRQVDDDFDKRLEAAVQPSAADRSLLAEPRGRTPLRRVRPSQRLRATREAASMAPGNRCARRSPRRHLSTADHSAPAALRIQTVSTADSNTPAARHGAGRSTPRRCRCAGPDGRRGR
jgi:hypothetical protein